MLAGQSPLLPLIFLAGKKDDKEESLSREQYQELQDWFVDDSEVPKLPEPETVCLTKGNEGEVKMRPAVKILITV